MNKQQEPSKYHVSQKWYKDFKDAKCVYTMFLYSAFSLNVIQFLRWKTTAVKPVKALQLIIQLENLYPYEFT